MIVDDEDAIVNLLLATLGGDERYRVIAARDGEEAMEMARRERPDVIFLDVLLPKMDGYQVCRALKSDSATSRGKIVLLTAMAQEEDRRRALTVGADGYLTKPFSPAGLLQTVEDLFGELGRGTDPPGGDGPAG